MSEHIPFRQETPRAITAIEARCYADADLALPWDEMSVAGQEEFRVNGPIPCDAAFHPGVWCRNCRFGEVEEV